MPIPLIPVLGGIAVTAIIWALSEKESPKKPAPGQPVPLPGTGTGTVPIGFPSPAPASSSDDIFAVAPNGVIVVRQDKQHLVYAGIAPRVTAPLVADVTRPPVSVELIDPRTGFSTPAIQWVQQESKTRGRHVLMHLRNPWLASVAPGDELSWASAARREWAVLAEGQAAGATPQPGIPPQTPPPGTVNTPWGPVTMPPGFIPASYDPNAQPGTTPQPGTPQPGTPAPGQPAPTQPQPGQTIQTPLGPITIPGGAPTTSTGPVPGGAVPPSPQQVQTRAGMWPANYTHAVRSGDLPSVWAQHYTGDFRRAEELRALNRLSKQGSGANTYYTPWNGVMALPLTWDVGKGSPPRQTAKKSGGGLADLIPGLFGATPNTSSIAQAKKLVAAAGEDPANVDEVLAEKADDTEAQAEAQTTRALGARTPGAQRTPRVLTKAERLARLAGRKHRRKTRPKKD